MPIVHSKNSSLPCELKLAIGVTMHLILGQEAIKYGFSCEVHHCAVVIQI